MKVFETNKIRNVGITAHGGAGKTSLTESLSGHRSLEIWYFSTCTILAKISLKLFDILPEISKRTTAKLSLFLSNFLTLLRKSFSLSSNFSSSKVISALRVTLIMQLSATSYLPNKVGAQLSKIFSVRI